MYFVPYCWFMYKFLVPDVIFYFDQVETFAEIKYVERDRIYFSYFHKTMNKEINGNLKIRFAKKIKKLEGHTKWKIIYSNTFPNRVAFLGVGNMLGLPSMLIIILFSIPMFFIKNYEPD